MPLSYFPALMSDNPHETTFDCKLDEYDVIGVCVVADFRHGKAPQTTIDKIGEIFL